MELLNEWFPTGKFRKVDTPFRTDYTYERDIMAELTLTGNDLNKSEMEHHGKLGHTIGQIQHIYFISRIDIFYTAYCLQPKLCHRNFLVSKVSSAVFNI